MNAIPKLQEEEALVKSVPLLKVLAGGATPVDRSRHIDFFWSFCHAALWNHRLFTCREIVRFKKLISAHFDAGKNTDLTFRQLIERVCLAKRYISRGKGRFLAKPEDWLNIHYHNGLAGTLSWYRKVQNQRKTVPRYNEGIKVLSHAVFHSCYFPQSSDLEHYRKKFIHLKEYDLLQIYMNMLLHLSQQ